MSYETRQTLLQKIQQSHNENSWEEFDGIYRPYVAAVIRKLGVSESLIDDLVQDVMLKIWKALPNFEYRPDHCHFRSWLSRICRNTVINFYNKRSSRQDRMTEGDEAALAKLSSDSGANELEDIAEREWRIYVADKAWQNIKDRYQSNAQSIYLLSLEGRSAADIAKELGVAENTVHIYRKRLQAAMQKEILRLNSY